VLFERAERESLGKEQLVGEWESSRRDLSDSRKRTKESVEARGEDEESRKARTLRGPGRKVRRVEQVNLARARRECTFDSFINFHRWLFVELIGFFLLFVEDLLDVLLLLLFVVVLLLLSLLIRFRARGEGSGGFTSSSSSVSEFVFGHNEGLDAHDFAAKVGERNSNGGVESEDSLENAIRVLRDG
jgi:hypothetical protein